MDKAKTAGAVELQAVLGTAVRGWRDSRGLSQEDVAARLRGAGLAWNRSQVAKLERGERNLTLGQAIQVAAALDVPLVELVTTSGMIRLGDDYDLRAEVVADVLAGRPPQARRDDSGLPARGVTRASVTFRATARFSATGFVITDIERRAARSLGVEPEEVSRAAQKLWGHPLAAERDRLLSVAEVEGKSTGTVRGHITRQLLRQLRTTMEKNR